MSTLSGYHAFNNFTNIQVTFEGNDDRLTFINSSNSSVTTRLAQPGGQLDGRPVDGGLERLDE